jgi:hypothetical protein
VLKASQRPTRQLAPNRPNYANDCAFQVVLQVTHRENLKYDYYASGNRVWCDPNFRDLKEHWQIELIRRQARPGQKRDKRAGAKFFRFRRAAQQGSLDGA